MRVLIPIFSIIGFLFAEEAKVEKEHPEAKAVFETFTGRIKTNKVRLRVLADLQSPIVKELKKNDLVYIIGQENDFYQVAPLPESKVYVFRSYIIDNVVEANRVNIRLLPNLESPVVGQLQQSEKVDGKIDETHPKWLAITPPSKVHFYISKDFVEKVGDKDFFANYQQRKKEVDKLLNSAFFLAQEEMKKSFESMNIDAAVAQFDAIIQGYSDFPESVEQAKEGLVLLKDNHLQKKLTKLENSPKLSDEKKELALEEAKIIDEKADLKTTEASPFLAVEEDLFLSWNNFHPNKTQDDFYQEEKVNAKEISGVLETMNINVKDIPGDYIIRQNGKCIGYLYSTKISLKDLVGKEVKLDVSSRPNNNFAYPAFFVHSVR